MKTSHECPPIFERLKEAFGVEWNDIAITYGDTVYCPGPLSSDLEAHEGVHIEQQKMFIAPDEWYDKYIADPHFRFDQELEAYRAQYQFIKKTYGDRNKIARRLHMLGKSLSGEMYGSLLTHQEAMNAIKSNGTVLI